MTITRGPMPTVEFNGKVYKLRSRKTEIPDLAALDRMDAAPNLPRLTVVVR